MAIHLQPNKSSPPDWHPADIVAAIKKRRSSFSRLSRHHGYADGSLRLALYRPWPKAERIIAGFIGLPPVAIWPSRYLPDGTPNRARGNPEWVRRAGNVSTRIRAGHVKAAGAR